MKIIRDPKLQPGVNQVRLVIIAGKTRTVVSTTYNANQEDYCIRRTLKRAKIDEKNLDEIKIELS